MNVQGRFEHSHTALFSTLSFIFHQKSGVTDVGNWKWIEYPFLISIRARCFPQLVRYAITQSFDWKRTSNLDKIANKYNQMRCALSQFWMLDSLFPELNGIGFWFWFKHLPLAKRLLCAVYAGNEFVMAFEANPHKSDKGWSRSGFFEINFDNGTNYISNNNPKRMCFISFIRIKPIEWVYRVYLVPLLSN